MGNLPRAAGGKGHIRRFHKLEAPIREKPENDLQFIVASTREVIQTSRCRVLGHFETESTSCFLLKSPKGTLAIQRENSLSLDLDNAEMRVLTEHEAIAMWNRCSVKLSADALFA